MLYDGREHVSLLQYPQIRDRVIMLDCWSTTYAITGWRLGYAVCPKALVVAATRLAIHCHSCVNAAAQHARIAALRGPPAAVAELMGAFAMRQIGRAHATN